MKGLGPLHVRYLLAICCRDERGNDTGRLHQIELSMEAGDCLLRIEAQVDVRDEMLVRWDPLYNKVRLGRRVIRHYRRREHVGNIFWDDVLVDHRAAALALTAVLRSRLGRRSDPPPKYSPTEGAATLMDAAVACQERGELLRASDIIRAAKGRS